jgi:hypothetical protein
MLENCLYDTNSQACFLVFFRASLKTSYFNVKLNEIEAIPILVT